MLASFYQSSEFVSSAAIELNVSYVPSMCNVLRGASHSHSQYLKVHFLRFGQKMEAQCETRCCNGIDDHLVIKESSPRAEHSRTSALYLRSFILIHVSLHGVGSIQKKSSMSAGHDIRHSLIMLVHVGVSKIRPMKGNKYSRPVIQVLHVCRDGVNQQRR